MNSWPFPFLLVWLGWLWAVALMKLSWLGLSNPYPMQLPFDLRNVWAGRNLGCRFICFVQFWQVFGIQLPGECTRLPAPLLSFSLQNAGKGDCLAWQFVFECFQVPITLVWVLAEFSSLQSLHLSGLFFHGLPPGLGVYPDINKDQGSLLSSEGRISPWKEVGEKFFAFTVLCWPHRTVLF